MMPTMLTIVLFSAVVQFSHAHGGRGHVHVSGTGGVDIEQMADDNSDKPALDPNFVRNKEHIKEHLKDEVNFDLDTATPEELDFHFFNIHDTDDDNNLDGLELYMAIEHALDGKFHDIENDPSNDDFSRKLKTDMLKRQIPPAIDKVMRYTDVNFDGLLSYMEFADSSRRGVDLMQRLRGENFKG